MALSYLYNIYTQSFPPPPTLTPSNLPPQTNRVFIVTGGSSGVGYHLSSALYASGGTVYILTRTPTAATSAISRIKSTSKPLHPGGTLHFIHLDLADLRSVRTAATQFLASETRLDVLFNNAGVAEVPATRRTAQDLESHIGINCVGHFLLTKLLSPLLSSTAASSPANSVRVIWTSSLLVDMAAPTGGLKTSSLDTPPSDLIAAYTASKTGNWFLASEFARRGASRAGIVSLTQNPGNLKTNVWRMAPGMSYWPFWVLLSRAEMGACTCLWVGMGEEVRAEDAGRYGVPFGRWLSAEREDLVRAMKGADEGGTGEAGRFWEWCEGKVGEFV
ncbi:NAD(P)-binding protein [Lepidopterella palustris CBS 459.81]|uniref:NAD(P)-binding protein n=1 Tax=Lepidopterella palustris CBS 459.81 TaxID=1314670 RepID=A0A8E2EH96_9PEZI|nr:NAD(P)-binding protein [Lepidopterella palustris CBS 459.81]